MYGHQGLICCHERLGVVLVKSFQEGHRWCLWPLSSKITTGGWVIYHLRLFQTLNTVGFHHLQVLNIFRGRVLVWLRYLHPYFTLKKWSEIIDQFCWVKIIVPNWSLIFRCQNLSKNSPFCWSYLVVSSSYMIDCLSAKMHL